MRPRLYWPVTIAAAALIALLTYGVASNGTDTSIDQALADGKRVEAPVKDLPRLGEALGAVVDDWTAAYDALAASHPAWTPYAAAWRVRLAGTRDIAETLAAMTEAP